MGGNGGKQTPALLFTASHGMAFPKGHERQFSDQGALLCQDWPGPRSGAIKRDYYFAAENIGDDARLSGMIAFFFACYGGGTPQYDEFARQNDLAQDIADHPFVANLPRRMLTHPNGGALAVLGHIERAWGYSFMENNEKQLNTFKSALVRLMLSEYRVGAVTEFFNGRYAEISSTLTHHLYQFTKIGAGESGQLVPGLWINNNDARGYALFGDPAVRLPIARAEPAEHTVPPPMIDVGAVAEAAKQAGEAKAKTGAESAPPPPPPGATPETPPEESFGLFGGDKEGEGVNIGEALKDVIQKMADTLKDVVDDMTTLQVNTYVSDNMQAVTKDIESDTVSGTLHLRARSSIKLDGDTETILPSTDGEIDTAVWEIHKEIVNQAQQNRNQLVGILVSFLNPKR
jgi:ribosome-associated translation inhibitor RaiA